MSISRQVIATIPIPALPGYENRILKLVYPPGVEGSNHTHPIPAIGYIVKGEHISQWKGSEREYYKAGDVFIDRAHDHHIYTSNPSKTEELVFLASYVVKIGEPHYESVVSP